ncbi:MAG: beta-N-acetylhexosaminidase [Aggregatilineales bacterium]
MNIQDKIGQMFLVGFPGLTAPDHILDWLREGRIGGVILFARNIDTPDQVAALCASVHDAAKYPALIAIDQEGGTVTRMAKHFTESPGAMALSTSGDDALTEQMSRVLADEMRALGINWTYAPVVDITYNSANPTVGTRSFGADAATVGKFAAAATRGFQSGGVAASAKHFPGLGNTAIDTHLALAVLDTDPATLIENDLAPYRECIATGLSSIMTTHTIFSALDSDYPATLSPTIVQTLLRDELKFEGVVVTDCMEMKAIVDNYGTGESAVLAVLAGIDIILVSHTREMQSMAYDAVLSAVMSGRVPESIIDEANTRIAAFKAQYKIDHTPTTKDVFSDEHQQIAQVAARAGTVLVKNTLDLIPVQADATQVALIEFAYDRNTEVMTPGMPASFGQKLQDTCADVATMTLTTNNLNDDVMEQAETFAAEAGILIIAARNLHLFEAKQALAHHLLSIANRSILVCLRNPYDAGAFSEADVILCTNGDTAPSLQAAIDALQGVYQPEGDLPVSIEMPVG